MTVTALQARILRLAQQERRQLRLDADARRAPADRSAIAAPPSVVQELDALLAELGELQVVDEAHDLAQARVDVRLVGAHLAHAERSRAARGRGPRTRRSTR